MKIVGSPKLSQALDRKLAHLKGPGLAKAAGEIARVVAEGNARDRLAGVDDRGRSVAPLKHPRTGPDKGKAGPPLAPDGARSRVVAGFRVVVTRAGDAWRIVAGWPGAGFLAYHDSGSGKLPRRPIAGMSPTTRAKVREVIARLGREVRNVR